MPLIISSMRLGSSCGSSVARVPSRPPRVPTVVRRTPAQQQRDVRVQFFNFGKKPDPGSVPMHASRDDYSADDVEHYFNYMGCLAVEGTYDRMEEMMRSGLEPVDIILLLAAAENDDPKIEELLAAGADISVKDNLGRRPADLATKEAVIKMLKDAEVAKV